MGEAAGVAGNQSLLRNLTIEPPLEYYLWARTLDAWGGGGLGVAVGDLGRCGGGGARSEELSIYL